MHTKDETKIERGVSWKLRFGHGQIFIVAISLASGRRKVCEYECPFNYRDGYSVDDVLEVYRIIDSFVEDLTDG